MIVFFGESMVCRIDMLYEQKLKEGNYFVKYKIMTYITNRGNRLYRYAGYMT